MDVKELDARMWTSLARDRVYWRPLLNTVMKI
jgi:hypothetical protein